MKIKPWLPDATPLVADGVGFTPTTEAWSRIESALGRPITLEYRAALGRVGSRYLALRETERSPPLAREAEPRVKAVLAAASALQTALAALLDTDGDPVAWRVGELFDIALREVDLPPGAPQGLGGVLSARMTADRLIQAVPIVQQKLKASTEAKLPTYAWEYLIDNLAQFAELHDVPATARKDYSENVSDFVKFVWAIQLEFPAEYRSPAGYMNALSQSISSALHR